MHARHAIVMALTLAGLTAAGFTPASATNSLGSSQGVRSSDFAVAVLTPATLDADSTHFAGYAAEVGRSRNATATIPVAATGSCAKDKGVVGQALQFGSTGVAGVTVFSACGDGKQVLFVRLIDADGRSRDVAERTKVGDKIKVTLTESGRFLTVAAANLTQGWRSSLKGPALQATAFQVGEGTALLEGVEIPLPDFGRASITGTTLGGQALTAVRPTRVHCVDGSGKRRMTTGAIVQDRNFGVRYDAP